LMFGCAFSNCATCALNWFFASCVLPGISDATLIVTAFVRLVVAALEIATTHTATKLVTVMAAIVTLRVDFIVLTPSSAPSLPQRRSVDYPLLCPVG
jgi:hypothetical protein